MRTTFHTSVFNGSLSRLNIQLSFLSADKITQVVMKIVLRKAHMHSALPLAPRGLANRITTSVYTTCKALPLPQCGDLRLAVIAPVPHPASVGLGMVRQKWFVGMKNIRLKLGSRFSVKWKQSNSSGARIFYFLFFLLQCVISKCYGLALPAKIAALTSIVSQLWLSDVIWHASRAHHEQLYLSRLRWREGEDDMR